MAKLYFRYGAMNSGKSTALMQVAHNYEEQGMRVLILKPKVDTKGSGDLVSRLGVRRPADLLVPPAMALVEPVRAASSEGRPLACVLCDESQFLTAEQAEQLFMVTVELNIPVICYGLRSDFSLKGFPGSTRLLELAPTIEEMKKNTGMNGEYHRGCILLGAMRNSAPSEDWCRVDRHTPKMVRMMVQRTTTLRHFLRKGNLQDSHSMGATENSMNSTVR